LKLITCVQQLNIADLNTLFWGFYSIGVRIFECEEGYGAFVRGKNVTVGGFPERGLLDSDDEGENTGVKGEEEEDEI
jgi:hypothetical protein